MPPGALGVRSVSMALPIKNGKIAKTNEQQRVTTTSRLTFTSRIRQQKDGGTTSPLQPAKTRARRGSLRESRCRAFSQAKACQRHVHQRAMACSQLPDWHPAVLMSFVADPDVAFRSYIEIKKRLRYHIRISKHKSQCTEVIVIVRFALDGHAEGQSQVPPSSSSATCFRRRADRLKMGVVEAEVLQSIRTGKDMTAMVRARAKCRPAPRFVCMVRFLLCLVDVFVLLRSVCEFGSWECLAWSKASTVTAHAFI